MTKSLVTGGAGFIGSNLVDYLVDQGHEVVVIDDTSANNDQFYFNDKVHYVKQNVGNYQFTRTFYDSVDYVFHLAAESRLQPAIENPINAVTRNCVGTTVALQCAREAGVKRFIYSSTSSGYGNNPYPNVETQPDDCLNPYSASKAAAEMILFSYGRTYGIDYQICRSSNNYGPRQYPEKLIPKIIECLNEVIIVPLICFVKA